MVRWSLSKRLVATQTIALALLWLLAVAASAIVMRHEINESLDSFLQEAAQRLLPLAVEAYREGKDGSYERPIAEQRAIAEPEEYLIYQLRDAEGRVLVRSHDAPSSAFPVPLRSGHYETAGWRYYTEHGEGQALFLHVAESTVHRTEAIAESLAWLAAPLLLLIPVAGLLIWWTVRQTTRPILQVREEIGARGGANLSAIAEGALPQELAPIVHDVNHLLERLSRALESERAFAANSAHELRTPVAAALAQAQRLAAQLAGGQPPGGRPPDRQLSERAQQIAATLRRLGDLVEKLLQLSRAEAGVALSRERVDLLPVVELLVEDYRRRSDVAARLSFDAAGQTALWAYADIDAFGIALRNVIDNAVIHGAAGTPIRIRLTPDKAIQVVSGGPAVPPEVLARATQRFERGATSGSGSGLGLAIADSIMRQSGGALELRSPASCQNDGFEAVLKLA